MTRREKGTIQLRLVNLFKKKKLNKPYMINVISRTLNWVFMTTLYWIIAGWDWLLTISVQGDTKTTKWHSQNLKTGHTLKLFEHYNIERDEYLNRILTKDETWVNGQFCEHGNKGTVQTVDAQSSTKQAQKIHTNTTEQKIMATLFWDCREFWWLNSLNKRSVQNKWHRMLMKGVVLLHDNTCPILWLTQRIYFYHFKW